MTASVEITDDLFHAGPVVRKDTVGAFIAMVDHNGRDAAGRKPQDTRCLKLRLDHNDSVHVPLPGMLIIMPARKVITVNKRQIQLPYLSLSPD